MAKNVVSGASLLVQTSALPLMSCVTLSRFLNQPMPVSPNVKWMRDFPGGPVAKTLCSQCRVRSLVRELDATCRNQEFTCCDQQVLPTAKIETPPCGN